jgi:hypothetical protein
MDAINRLGFVTPVAMSAVAFALVIIGTLSGSFTPGDQVWKGPTLQILLMGQLPMVLVFALTCNWRPVVRPLYMLTLQLLAWVGASGTACFLTG